ncbi:DEAD/DEAH box helicase family protein [Oscillibacter sp. MSJ-2]|uniref:DEAD/DEAH box helicase family protein n=1 Tax=Dysosmobacter acutus TaxID=2841504 RepID=A0ABS6FC12_9FIRM|nr:DEAD/DEAH box helicase family protein [Dysosmobacter acutus]MBU5627833.1 DEAD/DEAH box helicase family protein [Dysosmobacter acutus]
MKEVKSFKQSELVLRVRTVYDTTRLDLDAWLPFIRRLCSNRPYQEEAIRLAILYLATGSYGSLGDLARENFRVNTCIQEKYLSLNDFLDSLQMRDKLYATIDLATGTGKSYVMYGIAQIALGLGLVDRVLVLCPSLTIESALTEKFEALSGDEGLKALIPEEAVIKNPSIVSANETVKKGALCVENIHAVYEATGSSIHDSFAGKGRRTLVLNDEAHHLFNKPSGKTAESTGIKKWKAFLLDPQYDFRYLLGFTGTAYIDDEYFPDVIYRYSLRQAMEDRIIKNVDYVREDDSKGDYERFQKIYQNHLDNVQLYPLVKPISILVTRDIAHAKRLHEDFLSFLSKQENKPKEAVEGKVLIVTSAREHKANVRKLKYVDQRTDQTEWIISVSMLTEGWDVKNVFQIVPWEDRAFNSRLLIAQVLGRGLRVPPEQFQTWPRVIVFNHKAWSSKIKKLVNEVLEVEARVSSDVLSSGERSKYHFTVRNIDYSTKQIEVPKKSDSDSVDFTRLLSEGIVLESQSVVVEKGTTYETVFSGSSHERNYAIRNVTWTIGEVVDKLYDEFKMREWEGKTLRLGDEEYTQNRLPPREVIERIIRLSMEKRGNRGDVLVEKNAHKILSAFTPLLRKKSKSVVSKSVAGSIRDISTASLRKQSASVGMLRQDRTVYLTNNWENEITDEEQRAVIDEVLDDETFPVSAYRRDIDYCLFKTPVTTVLAYSKPERQFVDRLLKRENAALLTAWVKSRDRNFYEIEYSSPGNPRPESTTTASSTRISS